jgi:hypothetical protein
LKFDGFQHLAINGKFDCLRLYANYFSVEAWYKWEILRTLKRLI